MTVTKFITLSNFPLYLKKGKPLLTMTNKFIPIWKQQNLSNSLHSIFHGKQFHQKTHVNIRRLKKKKTKKNSKGKIIKNGKKEEASLIIWKYHTMIQLWNSFIFLGIFPYNCTLYFSKNWFFKNGLKVLLVELYFTVNSNFFLLYFAGAFFNN